MALKLQPTHHSYYCSESNCYVGAKENYGRCDYDSWDDFKDGWLDTDLSLDDDSSHLFRFDIYEHYDAPGSFDIWLFFILQRKGDFRPVRVKNITSDDIPEIEQFLRLRWEYLKNQWREFSN